MTMQQLIKISLLLVLVTLVCSWRTTDAHNIQDMRIQKRSDEFMDQDTVVGNYRKYNPDYDDWMYYVKDNESARDRVKRGFFETLSNYTRTSIFNFFNWGKTQSEPQNTDRPNEQVDDIDDDNDEEDEEEVEDEIPTTTIIPRAHITKVVDIIPNNRVATYSNKFISYDNPQINIRLNDIDEQDQVTTNRPLNSRREIYTDLFRRTHRTEDSLLPFFSHNPNDAEGPEQWPEISPDCGGNYQSPIALDDHSGNHIQTSKIFEIIGLYTVPELINIQNDGHSVKYIPNFNEGEIPYMHGGPLCCVYNLHHFHFHWGATDDIGSEHTFNDKRYSMELHIVTYMNMYGSFEEAQNMPKGLAVLAFFFEVTNGVLDQPKYLTKYLDQIINTNDTFTINRRDSFSLGDMLGEVPWNFVSYRGSLTTPPCSETVTWLVGMDPIAIEVDDMQKFRQLKDSAGNEISNNFRPLQKINGRKLYYYYDN